MAEETKDEEKKDEGPKSLEPKEVFDRINEGLGEGAALEFVEPIGDPFIYVAADRLVEVCTFLRDDEATNFVHLSLVTGLDWPEYFESVYHLVSYDRNHEVTLKVKMAKEDGEPECPSVVEVWRAADWHERETFDLVGINYTGHPQLERILLPEDWEGHPLRKDYVAAEEYHGISNLP